MSPVNERRTGYGPGSGNHFRPTPASDPPAHKIMLAARLLTLCAVVSASKVPISKVLTLRGGIDLGPITSSNIDGILKVAGAVTAAGAITEKYAGIDETTLTKTFKGDVSAPASTTTPSCRVCRASCLLRLLICPHHRAAYRSLTLAPRSTAPRSGRRT